MIAEYLSHSRQHPDIAQSKSGAGNGEEETGLTLNEIFLRYWNQHVVDYYVKHGNPTSEQTNIRAAFRTLLTLYGMMVAEEFGPMALRAYRQKQIDEGICRSQINKRVDRIKRMFAWAGEHEIVPPLFITGCSASEA